MDFGILEFVRLKLFYLYVKLYYGNLSQFISPYIYFLNLPIFYFKKLQGSFDYKSIHSTLWVAPGSSFLDKMAINKDINLEWSSPIMIHP